MTVTRRDVLLSGEHLAAALVTTNGSSAARPLGARFADVANVKDFGAKGDGITDDTEAIQTALNSFRAVSMPVATYKISAPLVLGDLSCLIGAGRNATILNANGINGPAIRFNTNPRGSRENQAVCDLTVTGTADAAIECRGAYCARIANVHAHGAFDYGFDLGLTYGSVFEHLSTNGSTIGIAAMRCHDGFAANLVNNFYTGHTAIPRGVYIPSNGGDSPPVGNIFNMLTLQGCAIGLDVDGCVIGLTVNGMYTENTVRAIKLGGSLDPSDYAYNIAITGGILQAPLNTHPHYAERSAFILLNRVSGCDLSNLAFWGLRQKSPLPVHCISYHTAYQVAVRSCLGPTDDGVRASILDLVRHEANANGHSSLSFYNPGSTGPDNSTRWIEAHTRSDGTHTIVKEYIDADNRRQSQAVAVPQAEYPPV